MASNWKANIVGICTLSGGNKSNQQHGMSPSSYSYHGWWWWNLLWTDWYYLFSMMMMMMIRNLFTLSLLMWRAVFLHLNIPFIRCLRHITHFFFPVSLHFIIYIILPFSDKIIIHRIQMIICFWSHLKYTNMNTQTHSLYSYLFKIVHIIK